MIFKYNGNEMDDKKRMICIFIVSRRIIVIDIRVLYFTVLMK